MEVEKKVRSVRAVRVPRERPRRRAFDRRHPGSLLMAPGGRAAVARPSDRTLLVTLGGVAVLVFGRGASFGAGDLLGDLLVVLNSLSYSTYLVLSRPALERHDPLTLISWVFVFGTIEMAIVGVPQLVGVDWHALTR